MTSVNIGQDNQGDAFYRYKMPVLQARVSLRGSCASVGPMAPAGRAACELHSRKPTLHVSLVTAVSVSVLDEGFSGQQGSRQVLGRFLAGFRLNSVTNKG